MREDIMFYRGKLLTDMTRDELLEAIKQLASIHKEESMEHIRQLRILRKGK
jgi:hypothetical protein